MTEEEAKTKWCPFVRSMFSSSAAASNRDSDGKATRGTRCIGSACMAWRWFETTQEQGKLPPPYSGYCGLAGKP